ncbi:hypothetical protein SK128_009238 [Halocaridina rubra]|uniref:Uncharacterized protein n=1 Tax=Halocaridina rubra TaxID=373956 RepID=A0AAN8XGM5_HALRR
MPACLHVIRHSRSKVSEDLRIPRSWRCITRSIRGSKFLVDRGKHRGFKSRKRNRKMPVKDSRNYSRNPMLGIQMDSSGNDGDPRLDQSLETIKQYEM